MQHFIKRYELQIFLVAVLLGFLTIFPSFIRNDVPFWYDPARDLLQAQDNLHKITLIGPTSGVPGIFYGPYWIWLLSIAELISKDPRVVTFLVQTVPYFTILPFLLWRMRKVWGVITSSALFLLFITGYNQYPLYLWNPHLAPLFLFIVLYILSNTEFTNLKTKPLLKILLAGLVTGLFVNFHISFGLGVVAGIMLIFIIKLVYSFWKLPRKNLIPLIVSMAAFFIGLGISFAPFALFEVRHNFQQTKIALETLKNGGSVAKIKGLDKATIGREFIDSLAKLLHLPNIIAIVVLICAGIFAYFQTKKRRLKLAFTPIGKSLLLYCSGIFIVVLYLYFTAKNPVWEYHFISLEILYLIVLGILLKHLTPVRLPIFIWALGWTVFQVFIAFIPLFAHPVQPSELTRKENEVRQIATDAGSANYSVFTYNPTHYSYDYSYLFSWLVKKDIPYRPELVPATANPIYVIIPHPYESQFPGYVRFRTPDSKYKTVKEWKEPDGTRIVKRELK